MLELDGCMGEGGGQILRTSLALSLLTGTPFHLRNVRARRSRPGLQPQHLTSVRAAAEVGRAGTRGASLQSKDLVFEPGKVEAGRYHFKIGTAGATGLVLHTVFLPLALRGTGVSEVTLEGGTHNDASPCFHFLDVTWQRYLALSGMEVSLRLRRPGFYPRGGGGVEAEIRPCPRPRGVQLAERGPLRHISGFSAVAGLPESIAERQARRAVERLAATGHSASLGRERWAGGPGTVLALVVEADPVPTLFFGLGARGKPAERVADEAADQALAFLDAGPAAVDPHSADQILLPLVLAEGPSSYTVTEVTSHLLTNLEVVRRFVDRKVACQGAAGTPGTVQIA